MAQGKKIKFVNYVIVDGKKILMSSLSETERLEVANRINDRAMKALGYVQIDETA